MRRTAVLISIVLAVVSMGLSQTKSSDRGVYGFTSIGASYDNSVGWSSETDSGIGYDLNRFVSVESGVPYYFINSTTAGSSKGSLGDVYFRVQVRPAIKTFDFKSSITTGAPTGDLTHGFSTGKATWTLANRVEKDFDHLTPFIEAGVGNTLGDSPRLHRAFTSVGNVGQFRGGASICFGKYLDLELSGYDVLPFGDQTIYSHSIGKGAAGNPNANKHRPFESAYQTTGTASLVEDNGLTSALNFSPNQRMNLEVAYNRSVPQELNSVSITVGLRLGHIQGKPQK